MKNRHLHLEPLEQRVLMAGDVRVAVSDHSLSLTGDGLGNYVEIWYLGQNRYSIDGTNGTTVSTKAGGKMVGSVIVDGITKDIKVDLKDGDDSVLLAGSEDVGRFSVLGKLDIRTGNGYDEVMLDYGSVNGNLNIAAGSEDDVIGLNDVRTNGDLSISAGAGVDVISVFEVVVRRDMNINAGSGDDEIALATLTVGRNTKLDGGSPGPASGSPAHLDQVLVTNSNFVRNLKITAGAGNDNVYLGNFEFLRSSVQTIFDESFDLPDFEAVVTGAGVVVGGDLSVAAKDGNNSVILVEMTVAGKANLDSEHGSDLFYVVDSEAKEVKISTRSGSDEVYFDGSLADAFFADLGKGDDYLGLTSSTVKRSLEIRGNSGHDALARDTNNRLPSSYKTSGWEAFL